jgi:alpha-glucosidase (family GH31 glycosyl hydrolase)
VEEYLLGWEGEIYSVSNQLIFNRCQNSIKVWLKESKLEFDFRYNRWLRYWWSRQYEHLLDLGMTGFWHDMNETGVFTLWGNASLPPQPTQHDLEGRDQVSL